MRTLFLIASCCLIRHLLLAQNAASIIAELKTINATIVNTPCNTGEGMLISNRALNIFFSNKIGTYLTNENDLSLYKNNITLNASEGKLAISHNLYDAKGLDERVKSMMTVGLKANVINAYQGLLLGKKLNNDLGFTIKQTWIAKGKSYFDRCMPEGNVPSRSQKQIMDARRAAILHRLEAETNKKSADFEADLTALTPADVLGQDLATVKATLRQKFYLGLKEEYHTQFAELQSETLIETNNYKLITTNWTSINVYVPLFRQQFIVAKSFVTNFEEKHAYPFEIALSHTRFLEGTKLGRFFLNLSGSIYWNNAAQSRSLSKINLTDYKSLGGKDTLHIAELKHQDAYIGAYKGFITPVLRGQVVYIPPDWHFGLTCQLEQNFGSYHVTNGKLGIPVVLIDKKGAPAINFEFQVRFFDLGNTINPDKTLGNKTLVGVSMGMPFSKIAY